MKIFGYASTFGNVDSHKDLVCKGAFSNTLRSWENRKLFPLMLYGHSLKIGTFSNMKETDTGLWVEGNIEGNSLSQKVISEVKNNSLSFFSIGFRPILAQKRFGIRLLKEIDLIEVSVVKRPANFSAKIYK